MDAILEGLENRQADEAELLAKHAFDLRYALNHKKPKVNVIFNRKKLNNAILKKYGRLNVNPERYNDERIEAIRKLNNHFMRKGE